MGERFSAKLDAIQQRLDREALERAEERKRGEARMLLQRLASAGHTVTLEGDRIRVSPRPDDATTAALITAKPELLLLLRDRHP